MFDLDRFIEDCRTAVAGSGDDAKAVRETVAKAMSDPAAVLAAVGEPDGAGATALYHAPDLTIINVVWAPMMTIVPHDHRMWAVIGIYSGREDNIFWRRRGDRVEAAGAASLSTGDVCPLGRDVVHSLINPIPRLTGALHVYGGDFFGESRSEWDPEELTERPYDVEKNMRLFKDAEAGYAAANG